MSESIIEEFTIKCNRKDIRKVSDGFIITDAKIEIEGKWHQVAIRLLEELK